jgi:hypothetical protein
MKKLERRMGYALKRKMEKEGEVIMKGKYSPTSLWLSHIEY